mgnify:CR=1 FL=1
MLILVLLDQPGDHVRVLLKQGKEEGVPLDELKELVIEERNKASHPSKLPVVCHFIS